jgi:hypothetical protein
MTFPMKALVALNVALLAVVAGLLFIVTAQPADAAKPRVTLTKATIKYVVEYDGPFRADCGSAGRERGFIDSSIKYATGSLSSSSSYGGQVVTEISGSSVRKASLLTASLVKCEAEVVTGVTIR